MAHTTRLARIAGPVAYTGSKGRRQTIPLGPCIVETTDGELVDIIWGANGQNSAPLKLTELANAEGLGHLVLLD